MRKIPFIHLLRDKADISLKQAKDIKERVMNDEIIKLDIANSETAEKIIFEAEKLGVVCEMEQAV